MIKRNNPVWLVTGGAGFIGSNFVRMARNNEWARIVNLDKLTYAGNLLSLDDLKNDEDHIFVRGDIGDAPLVRDLLLKYEPDAVVNFAAESHVDRSIHGPKVFVQTNVLGTFNLLDEVRGYWKELEEEKKKRFRFLHVSTDEVYGSLGPGDKPFTEFAAYTPNSPYSASKASGDHFVRAYYHTYGLPVITTNCSNNYGPYQFPEKLIPLMIINAMEEKPMPVYGDGMNVRDWLYVEDHCTAVYEVLKRGRTGGTYNIGGRCEKTNIEIVKAICSILNEIRPLTSGRSYESLITFVKDRPGHDRRYAIDDGKISKELGWKPRESFESGLVKTVKWYLKNRKWIDSIRGGSYREWISLNYEKR
jgi:dTDP-glucose 4,6-dehydratase